MRILDATSLTRQQPASSRDSTFHSNLLLDERKSYFSGREMCPPCLQKLPLRMPLHRIGRAAAYCKRLPVTFCVRCVASFPSILLKIVLLKGHSAASVCESPARIMKPQETRIQSGAKSFRTPTLTVCVSLKTHTYVRDIQSAAGVKSLDPWPLFGPMRTSSTGGARPRRQPINSRQFRRRREGGSISKINDSPLHAFCYFFFCSIGLISSPSPPTCSALLCRSIVPPSPCALTATIVFGCGN